MHFIVIKIYIKRLCKKIIYGLLYCADILRTKRKQRMQRYPKSIQLPITYKCNFDCKMCGMKKQIKKRDFTADELKQILQNQLFKKVISIGVNGGEPFLKPDLAECFENMLEVLPNLKEFHIISNGYFTERMLSMLVQIKKSCGKKNVKLNLALSIDGVQDMQDFMRGKEGAWEHVINTFEHIREKQDKYCDYLNIICTITRYNIYRINEVDFWSKQNNVDVAYNIATINNRIENEDRIEDFSIFYDETARLLTQEFFYKKYRETHSRRFFAIYLFVKTGKRYAPCECMYNNWVTLTPDCQIGYCATHSKNLGNALEKSAYEIFNNNIGYLKNLKAQYCETCSHYIYALNKEGKRQYYKDRMD